MKSAPKAAFALLALVLAAGQALAAEMQIIDLSTNPDPEKLMSPVKMKVVKVDKKAFFTDYYLEFVTRGQWTAGGAGYNKEVSATLSADLVGVPDETFQAIVDEAFAYTNEKFAELYTMIPDAEAQGVLKSFEKIAESPSKTKPEDLKIAATYANVFQAKKFAAGGQVRFSPTGASGMGAYKAWNKAQNQLAGTNISYQNKIEFARVASSLGGDSKEKTANVSIAPQLFMVGGGAGFSTTNMKMGMLQNGAFAGFTDKDWVKETRKIEDGKFEVVADPELYKAAALKLVKAHIDALVTVAKANK